MDRIHPVLKNFIRKRHWPWNWNPRMVLKEEHEQFWLRPAWAVGQNVRAITQAQ